MAVHKNKPGVETGYPFLGRDLTSKVRKWKEGKRGERHFEMLSLILPRLVMLSPKLREVGPMECEWPIPRQEDVFGQHC